jgi:hypothetical protein
MNIRLSISLSPAPSKHPGSGPRLFFYKERLSRDFRGAIQRRILFAAKEAARGKKRPAPA